ncbi:MAG: hypothetical protein DRI97_15300 [Bacteroidetes bacterium]|nr:MAG: hypothetical protein DRI97_15300 [Bacteroidota bacterium]RLD79871.1 MAG: hypothetical protein DRJ15_08420 [Bacteroidota bacterium]
MDFTIKTYKRLLIALRDAGYIFQPFADFIEKPAGKSIVLRHDVDERPKNALKMAKAEHELGIRATYYFRIVKISNAPDIIKQIVALGHELGYHYEDYSACNGEMDNAIRQFEENLDYFRSYYPVKTVCMHGSSMSDHDNRLLWKENSLKDFGLIGEPYLSVDYDKVFYMTDTGRCWDGSKYNVRDYVKSTHNLFFHRTDEIILALGKGTFPEQVILQSHTLWTDNSIQWYWLAFREWLRNSFKVMALRVPGMKKLLYRLIKIYSK